MAENPCGGCTACCRVMEIEELQKPRHEFCEHAPPGATGCAIYENRPESCREFTCLWLASQGKGEGGMPARMRPDRSRVVLVADELTLVLHPAPGYERAWEDDLWLVGFLRLWERRGGRVLVYGRTELKYAGR